MYFLSLLYGPDDIGVSGGCYLLAKVFDTQGHLERSKGAYTRILEIWSAHFSATEKALGNNQCLMINMYGRRGASGGSGANAYGRSSLFRRL